MTVIFAPPGRDVFPTGDQDFAVWAANFVAFLPNVAPLPPVVIGTYTGLAEDYTTALSTATNPATRTASTIAAKDAAKTDLVAASRSNAAYVQARVKAGTLTLQLLASMGLRAADARSTINPPSDAPMASVRRIIVGGSFFAVRDPLSPDRLAKPIGVSLIEGRTRFGAVTLPSIVSTRANFLMESDPSRVGTSGFASFRYLNAKGQGGPWSTETPFVVT